METISKNIYFKVVLFFIGTGIWAIVLQNAGIIPSKQGVYVKGGNIDADISQPIEVRGQVEIENTIDVNIQQINGEEPSNPYRYILPGERWPY